MRRAAFAVVSTVAALVLLLSFKTHGTTPAAAPPAVSGTTGTEPSGAGSGTAGSSATAGGSTASGAGKSGASGSFTGAAADTRFGPVQVQITVVNGKLTAATAVQYPTESPRDQEINAYAVPVLNQETVSAGSASIDTVSGATFTSEGYLTSLQSALDQAGI